MTSSAFTRSRQRVAALRLRAQGIGAAGQTAPVEAVRRMLAMQGQDLPGVKWSMGVRATGATEADVDAAFDAGELVRSWPLRGTLHVVAAEDLAWMLELTTSRAMAAAAGRRAALGLTDADVGRAREAAGVALSGGRALVRDALLAAIRGAGVSTAGQRGYHLLSCLAQTGTLVLGPRDGGQQRFALLHEWVPNPRRLEPDEALAELAVRYVRGHGPATAADLARWSGLTMGDVRRGLAACGDRVETLELDGVTCHLAPETLDLAAPSSRVHLLPGFDEYVLGYKDRSAVLSPEHADAIVPGANGLFRPTIVADGEIAGTWRRSLRGGAIVIEPAPFNRLPAWAREILAEAARTYGAFVGQPAMVAWTPAR